MTKKIFYQFSFYSVFYMTFFTAMFVLGAVGTVGVFFWSGEKFFLRIFVFIGGLVYMALGMFEFFRMLFNRIFMFEDRIFVAEEKAMKDEKIQYRVDLKFNQIERMFLKETVNDSRNKPIPRYSITVPKMYIVFECKGCRCEMINITFYSKRRRIIILDEIIARAKYNDNNFTEKTGAGIYDDFIGEQRKKKRKIKGA